MNNFTKGNALKGSGLYTPGWSFFSWDKAVVSKREAQFLRQYNILARALSSVGKDERDRFIIEITNAETARTPILNKGANFGGGAAAEAAAARMDAELLDIYNQCTPPEKQGYADMMHNIYKTGDKPLTHDKIFAWHDMIMRGRTDMQNGGLYNEKKSKKPRPRESGYREIRYFSNYVPSTKNEKMHHFITWYNNSHPERGKNPLPILWRAGLAYYYFISILPFERGNGRIARAIAEKSVSRWSDMTSILALSKTIHTEAGHYQNLQEQICSSDLAIDAWLDFFADAVIDAQQQRQQALDNFMVKIGFYGSLNKRQGKIMSRMFWPGPNDFKDGLTVEEYIAITDATPTAAKQDVTDLVARGLLRCIGDRLYRLKYNRLNA